MITHAKSNHSLSPSAAGTARRRRSNLHVLKERWIGMTGWSRHENLSQLSHKWKTDRMFVTWYYDGCGSKYAAAFWSDQWLSYRATLALSLLRLKNTLLCVLNLKLPLQLPWDVHICVCSLLSCWRAHFFFVSWSVHSYDCVIHLS